MRGEMPRRRTPGWQVWLVLLVCFLFPALVLFNL